MIKNDELEVVEDTAVEVDVDDKAPESAIGGIGLGVVAATGSY